MFTKRDQAAPQALAPGQAIDPGYRIGRIKIVLKRSDSGVQIGGHNPALTDPAGLHGQEAQRGPCDHAGQPHAAKRGIEELRVGAL